MNQDTGAPAPRAAAGFLPDLCTPSATLPLVLLAGLVALALAVARAGRLGFWQDLGNLALFCEFLTLASAAVLCSLRKPLVGRSAIWVSGVTYAALLATAWGFAEAAYFVLAWVGNAPAHGLRGQLGWVGRIVLVAAIVDALVLRYLYISAEWRDNVRREAASRLEALTARIRPHFLFNTLNTAAALVADRPEAAERTLEDLAELFRASLKDRASFVPLADELGTARRYLEIEGLRLGARLSIAWHLDPGIERGFVPPFILQPLVENAVTHGIEPRSGSGTVEISGRRVGDRLELMVRNPVGPPAASEGHGIGLAGVRARLALAYGPTARLETERDAERFTASLDMPWKESVENSDRR